MYNKNDNRLYTACWCMHVCVCVLTMSADDWPATCLHRVTHWHISQRSTRWRHLCSRTASKVSQSLPSSLWDVVLYLVLV